MQFFIGVSFVVQGIFWRWMTLAICTSGTEPATRSAGGERMFPLLRWKQSSVTVQNSKTLLSMVLKYQVSGPRIMTKFLNLLDISPVHYFSLHSFFLVNDFEHYPQFLIGCAMFVTAGHLSHSLFMLTLVLFCIIL